MQTTDKMHSNNLYVSSVYQGIMKVLYITRLKNRNIRALYKYIGDQFNNESVIIWKNYLMFIKFYVTILGNMIYKNNYPPIT